MAGTVPQVFTTFSAMLDKVSNSSDTGAINCDEVAGRINAKRLNCIIRLRTRQLRSYTRSSRCVANYRRLLAKEATENFITCANADCSIHK